LTKIILSNEKVGTLKGEVSAANGYEVDFVPKIARKVSAFVKILTIDVCQKAIIFI
jgi:hypothetical protein